MDGATDTYSSYHTGGSSWEWLEVTHTVSGSISLFKAAIYGASAGDVAYISQPMLVFGSSIGEGNYAPRPGEIIWFEKEVSSNTLDADGWGDVATTTLNAEADSNGSIGKGVRAIYLWSDIRDSASAGESINQITLLTTGNDPGQYINSIAGLANDARHYLAGQVACNSDGDFNYIVTASGADTLDINQFKYLGIQTR